MNLLISLILPVVGWVGAGALLRQVRVASVERALQRVVDVLLFAVIPVFIGLDTWRAPAGPGLGRVIVVAVLVVVWGGIAAAVLARRWGADLRVICLPVMFMNSANLAIPVNTLLFGPAGTVYAVGYSVAISLLLFTVGISRVAPDGWRDVVRQPIFYAAIFGIAANRIGWSVPAAIQGFAQGLAAVALPAMLIVAGYSLEPSALRGGSRSSRLVAALAARMAGGAVVGWLAGHALGLSGPAAGGALVTSAMPPAVNTALLTRKYAAGPEFAAALVAAGTAVSLLILPLLAALVR